MLSSAEVYRHYTIKPFHSQVQKVHSPNLFRSNVCEVVRIGSINHLSCFV